MKQTSRELLVTTKMAESWRQDFDSNVEGLMTIVSKVDDHEHIDKVTEILDVYHSDDSSLTTPAKKNFTSGRPFEFTVFRN